MAIKFENASGPLAKPTEKRAEAAHPLAGEEDKKKAEASAPEVEGDKASAKKIKQRSSFKKK